MNQKLKNKVEESLSAVLPITMIVLILSILVAPLEINALMMFLVGAVLLVIGMGMFQLGAEMAMGPLGEGIGVSLAKSQKIIFAVLISFLMGLLITIAEPDLQVLSNQVPAIPSHLLILTVAVGVGLFLALAVLRIMFKVQLSYLLIGLYLLLIGISYFVPEDFLAVAFDSGGVTTGPITVPFIMAMGIGISAIRSDKDAASDSFGLVALSSIGPIIAVMLLGCFFRPQDALYEAASILEVRTLQDVVRVFAREIPYYAKEVLISLLPIILMYVLFQLLSKRFQKRQRIRIMVGFVYTYMGLVFFLCGVNVGFAPVGAMLGELLASASQKYLLIPIGMLIGYYIVKAEPAIQILNQQIQSVTNGVVSAKSMNHCLSIGVSISIGLAMLRILTGIPIRKIIIPGYIAALVMALFVPKIFVGIAFDSGGVASGPMTSTFLLPLCIGACSTLGGNIMTDAFGVVALVALTPLIFVQLMGIQYKMKTNRMEKKVQKEPAVQDDFDEIIEI